MKYLKNITIIIPSLDPDYRLGEVVSGVIEQGFTDIVIVDDGSKPENKKYFPTGEGITLLVHDINKGKGEALKTAIDFIHSNRPNSVGSVTCDGDGQHLAKDIKRVAEKLKETNSFILGVRDFNKPDVPFKSKFGNKLSSLALALCSGVKTQDTQTGLRGISASLYKEMLKVSGSRFEYETNVLLELSNMKCKYYEVEIETVYHEENKGSHYRPIIDSLRIMSLIIRYIFSSLLSFIIDNGLFMILHSLLLLSAIPSVVIARIVSSVANFLMNKTIVFKSDASVLKSIVKYYMIAIPIMLISAFGLDAVTALLHIREGSIITTLLKIVIDTLLFIISFTVQKKWIFRKK